MRPVLVSACLLGLKTRYDGEGKGSPEVVSFLRQNALIPVPVCPEQLGGLPTPRKKVCFQSGDGFSVLNGEGDLISEDGMIMNAPFVRGAQQVLQIAKLAGCHEAILKERSPSCGSSHITRNDALTAGQGVTCALLRHHGIRIFSEETLPKTGNETLT